MGIEYYVGTEGPTINVKTPQDLYDAIDLIHTQVLDNFGERSPYLLVLDEAMKTLENEFGLLPS